MSITRVSVTEMRTVVSFDRDILNLHHKRCPAANDVALRLACDKPLNWRETEREDAAALRFRDSSRAKQIWLP